MNDIVAIMINALSFIFIDRALTILSTIKDQVQIVFYDQTDDANLLFDSSNRQNGGGWFWLVVVLMSINAVKAQSRDG